MVHCAEMLPACLRLCPCSGPGESTLTHESTFHVSWMHPTE